ncbi:PH domain-containing protein [Eupransor demetentiae]|uniref:Contains bPH2 (Bacterial pleckstrin homology) domain (YdbS) n=1 Tax=Eupransor demetentiae TaxID=3109584 RepID=A0ABM9N475_9LACO|nr:Uncharacterized membrane protein YdbS [Lactobacillaceae bacterium LMG 33000]
MQHLPKRIKIIWWQITAFNLFLWLVLIAGIIIAHHFWNWLPLWLLYFVGAGMVVEIVTEIILIPYRYAIYEYEVRDTDVEIRHGYFFRHHVAIPIARVQNVDLHQGPLLRLQKLYKVKIATGGSTHEIEALDHEEALRLKEQVMALALEARNAF